MHWLLHPAFKPAEVTVLRQSEVRSNHTTRHGKQCINKTDNRSTMHGQEQILTKLQAVIFCPVGVTPNTSWLMKCVSLNSSSGLDELVTLRLYISSVRLQHLCRKCSKPFHLSQSFNFYFKGLKKKLDLESQQKISLKLTLEKSM